MHIFSICYCRQRIYCIIFLYKHKNSSHHVFSFLEKCLMQRPRTLSFFNLVNSPGAKRSRCWIYPLSGGCGPSSLFRSGTRSGYPLLLIQEPIRTPVPTGSIQFQSVLGNAGDMCREPALALKNTGLGPLAIIADPKFRSYYEIP